MRSGIDFGCYCIFSSTLILLTFGLSIITLIAFVSTSRVDVYKNYSTTKTNNWFISLTPNKEYGCSIFARLDTAWITSTFIAVKYPYSCYFWFSKNIQNVLYSVYPFSTGSYPSKQLFTLCWVGRTKITRTLPMQPYALLCTPRRTNTNERHTYLGFLWVLMSFWCFTRTDVSFGNVVQVILLQKWRWI